MVRTWCVEQASLEPESCPFPDRLGKLSSCWVCLEGVKPGKDEFLLGIHRPDLAQEDRYEARSYCSDCKTVFSDQDLLKSKAPTRCPICDKQVKRGESR
jgi:hypothetical protein